MIDKTSTLEKKQIRTEKAPAAIGPYSQAILVAPFLFTSGQIPVDPSNGQLVEGGIEAQTRQVFENLKAVLAEAGSDFSKVVKSTVFLKDMNDFGKMNEVYTSYFKEGILPARSAVQVARLPKDVAVEIEMIALV